MICKLIHKDSHKHPELWRSHFIFSDVLQDKPLTGKILDHPGTHITFMDREEFSGKFKETTFIHTEIEGGFQKKIVIGLGKQSDFTLNRLREAVAELVKELKKRKIATFSMVLDHVTIDAMTVREVATAVVLASYGFDKHKSQKSDGFKEVFFELEADDKDAYIKAMEEGVLLGNATVLARNLTNEPANILTPQSLAERVEKVGEKAGFKVEILHSKDIEKLKMDAFMAVAKGSKLPPELIVMRYNGNPDSDFRLGMIGKGLTYDTGGLSLKPTKGMVTMRSDMGGAAAVLGAMMAIGRMALKINVTAVIAACENAISGDAYRPGDIISSMAGKEIYIENTDAEGRLTLIDALHYMITHENADYLVDIATLTGAAVKTLGTVATVTMSNDDDFYKVFMKAADETGEKAWRMPMFEEYKDQLKHPYADLTNAPGVPGAITAGLFLNAFVEDKPWIHLDIAGTSWLEKPRSYYSKGATGVGVRSLYLLNKYLADHFR